MMNSCKNESIEVNGFTVLDKGYAFEARKNDITIIFIAEGKNGGLYTRVLKSINWKTYRAYTAQRYLTQYIHDAQSIAFYLADNDYLWDYVAQKPFLETREKAKQAANDKRIAEGKPKIY